MIVGCALLLIGLVIDIISYATNIQVLHVIYRILEVLAWVFFFTGWGIKYKKSKKSRETQGMVNQTGQSEDGLMKTKGLGVRQICRLTGESYYVVQKS